MSHRRSLTSIAAISAFALWPAIVHAQSADAQALFGDGNRLMSEGKLDQACAAFEASNRIEPGAGTLIQLGECREQNSQLASAWSAYQDALARAKDESKKAYAAKKVAELEPQLSTLAISVPPADRPAGLELERNGHPLDTALWNRPAPVDGGSYVIVAHAPGRREWKTTITVPRSGGKLAVDVPALDKLPEAVPAPEPAPVRAVVEPAPSLWTGRRKVAIATAALAVAGGVTGAIFGELARSSQHDAEAVGCTPDVPCADGARAQSLIDTAHSRALDANIAFGVAGAAAIATGVLWLTGAPETHGGVAIVPAVAPGVAALAIHGSF